MFLEHEKSLVRPADVPVFTGLKQNLHENHGRQFASPGKHDRILRFEGIKNLEEL